MLPEGAAGRAMVDGAAAAPVSVLAAPLSLWGGFDPTTGMITDVHHPQHGEAIAGTIVVMASGRGSSSASSVLAEAVRLGSAPPAFVLIEPDEILVLGSVVGHELYGVTTPVLIVEPSLHAMIRHGHPMTISPGGTISGG
jgi:predicted aconitase with swiveling domain